MKTFTTILASRPWVAHIDDERADGNSIIVTLHNHYNFQDNPDCGVQGFDTAKEVELATRFANIIQK